MAVIPLWDDPSRPPFEGRRLLERALVAVAFTPIARITSDTDFVSQLQDRLRHQYPFFRRQAEPNVRIDLLPTGEIRSEQEENVSWQFASADHNRTIVLNQSSISFDARAAGYTSWSSFIEAVREVLQHFADTMSPGHVVRLGIRYLNTGIASGVDDPRRFCAQELVSISGNEHLQIADLLWHFNVREGRMLLRNGLMPPKGTYDPSFFRPREDLTWYLDIDVVKEGLSSFSIDEISNSLYEQARRLHAVYYWAMTREGEEK